MPFSVMHIFCTENFREIQFNHRFLAYLLELLSTRFEAHLSAFHTSPFVQISLGNRPFVGLKKYSVVVVVSCADVLLELAVGAE
jgi:hypothetical protein